MDFLTAVSVGAMLGGCLDADVLLRRIDCV